MNDVLTDLQAKLKPFGQEHLLAFWDRLEPAARQRLAEQIDEVDLELMRQLFAGATQAVDYASLAARAESPPAVRLGQVTPAESAAARQAGEAAIRDGKVALILVAGGQGSRLGFDHPKGMFTLGPVSQRTLFEIHLDFLRAMATRYETHLPLYLMTSPATHDETLEFFAAHDQFGLQDEDLRVFCQGTMPAVDAQSGKLLLAEPGQLFQSPDGHGGMLRALERSGGLREMQDRGIELVFYWQVDNPLVRIADPEFLGHHLLSGSEMTTQVVAKRQPQEKVGNVISVDGTVQIIEYSDLPADQADRREPDGSLTIWAGSIAVHAFHVDFLQRAADRSDSLPFHRALKQVPFTDTSGTRVEPDEPNAIKYEKFIFDLLPLARNALVVEVAESEGFAPLKNASGAEKDTPETTRAAMVAQHRRWLAELGVEVAPDVQVEIHPQFAMDTDQLASRVSRDQVIQDDHYFR